MKNFVSSFLTTLAKKCKMWLKKCVKRSVQFAPIIRVKVLKKKRPLSSCHAPDVSILFLHI